MIHVIGNAALDSVIRVNRFPRPGETVVALGAAEDLAPIRRSPGRAAAPPFASSPQSALTPRASAFA
jgi:hypothetical protein